MSPRNYKPIPPGTPTGPIKIEAVYDDTRKIWVGYAVNLPGFIATGKSEMEARARVELKVEQHLAQPPKKETLH